MRAITSSFDYCRAEADSTALDIPKGGACSEGLKKVKEGRREVEER